MSDEFEILGEGRFLRLVSRSSWEFVERQRATGVVVIVALTRAGEMVFIEQRRASVGGHVVELPAGLVGDTAGAEHETMESAARRELEEETGFAAGRVETIMEGPSSPGLSNEVITFVLATGLRRVGPGGGDDDEDIRVEVVPLGEADAWLAGRRAAGMAVDPRVYAGLYFALRYVGRVGS